MEMQNRSVYRGQVTRIAKTAADYLLSEESQPRSENPDQLGNIEEEIAVLLQRMTAARENLTKANADIRAAHAIKQEDQEKELESCLEYDDKAFSVIARLNHRLSKVRELRGDISTEPLANSPLQVTQSSAKLPRLELKRFSGDFKEWLPFWEQFRIAVHENKSLNGPDKFNYLMSVLTGKAKESIAGFTPTENCYHGAIALLQEEYGDIERIIDKNMQHLMALQPVNSRGDVNGLRKLYNSVISGTRSLTALGVPSTHYYVMLKSIILKCMPAELRIEFYRHYDKEEYDQDNSSEEMADSVHTTKSENSMCTAMFNGDKQVKRLLIFLKREVESLEKSNIRTRPVGDPKPITTSTAAGLFATNESDSCYFCNSVSHTTQQCNNIQSITHRKGLLKRGGRCYRCTDKGHFSKNCRAKNVKCMHCNRRHATSMCEAKNKREMTECHQMKQLSNDENKRAGTINLCSTSSCNLANIYLQTARAFICNPRDSSKLFVRLLIDGGSQRTFVKQSISRKLKLPVVGLQHVRIATFGSRKPHKSRECNLVRFDLKSQYSDRSVSLIALEVDEICEDVLLEPSPAHVDFSRFQLADTSPRDQELEKGICILIGSDNYWNIVSGENEFITHNLAAVKTMFGWTLQGPSMDISSNNAACFTSVILHTHTEGNFSETKFWDLESIGITNEEQSEEDLLNNLGKYIARRDDHYEAKLLWRRNNQHIDSNREGAQSRFSNLIRKLLRDPQQLFDYEEAMEEFIYKGFVEQIDNATRTAIRKYYLPHRAVYRDDKETSKVRIVFDASAHSGGNASLNSLLSPGPNLMPDVLSILLNFRVGETAIVADIEKAFLQIHLAEEDRDVHRFFWFSDKIQDVNNLPAWTEFRMTRVTFGITCSPFLLNATIRRHLDLERLKHEETCAILERSFYMDDLICSVHDVPAALKIYEESKDIMSRAGMHLRKWNSNKQEVRARFVKVNQTPVVQKVLGLRWFVNSDELATDMGLILSHKFPQLGTKRDLLGLISKIYDPLGLLGPYVVKLKLLFQEAWRLKLKWDEILPETMQRDWNIALTELSCVKNIILPRCISFTQPTFQELHLFADASTKAYGVVAYVRNCHEEGNVTVSYLCSKNRIAPLKDNSSPELTLPKLELTAALIAVRLYVYLKKHLKLRFKAVVFWSDSQIALSWIRGDPKKWKPYVSHRIQEIRQYTSENDWRHCPGNQNPADILTRGISGKKLLSVSSWLQGPNWLKERGERDNVISNLSDKYCTPLINCFLATCENIVEKRVPLFLVERYSNYQKLLRITAYVIRFVMKTKKKRISAINENLCAGEISEAETYWIRFYQSQEYASEINKLKQGYSIDGSSKILNLNPFLDQTGILRVRTRFSAWNPAKNLMQPWDEVFPIIIPNRSYLAKILIMDVHLRMLHVGVNTLLAELRKRFWIPKGRQLIKSVIKPCVVCQRLKRKAANQPFAPLPAYRISASRPFENTGIDFAGPLFVKEPEGHLKKIYIMLFTCAVVRAIHLELVPNLTTESCLLGFRRFIARRGIPATILSDNARTFKRASNELSALSDILLSSEFQGYSTKQGISWQFIVERAPWWGGFWERLVRSVKDILKAAISRATLNSDQLHTFLVETEGVVNSRPLTYISDDPNDLSPLTPAHFLKGNYTAFSWDETHSLSGKDLRLRWNSRLRATKYFWKRWKTEYLNQLRSAHYTKHGSSFTIKEGDVVLIHDNLTPRLLWKLAIVQRVFPGRDGKIRACELRLSNGSSLRRPIQLLYPLEIPPAGGC